MESKKNSKVKRQEKEDLVAEIRKIPFKLELQSNSCPADETENLIEMIKQDKYYRSFFTRSCEAHFMEYTKTQDIQINFDRIENSPSNAYYPGSKPKEEKPKIFPETFSECLKKKPSKEQIQRTHQQSPSSSVVQDTQIKDDANNTDDPFSQLVNVSKSYQTLEFPKPKSDYYSEKFYKIGNYFIDNLHNSLEKDTKKLVDQLANKKSKKESVQLPSVKQMESQPVPNLQFVNPPPIIDPTMGFLHPILSIPPNFSAPSIQTIPLSPAMEVCLLQLQNSNSRDVAMQRFHLQQQYYQYQQINQMMIQHNNQMFKKKKN